MELKPCSILENVDVNKSMMGMSGEGVSAAALMIDL